MSGDWRRLCNQGRLKEALNIVHVMEQRGIPPDSSTYTLLLQECVNKKALAEAKLIHAHMIGTGFHPENFLATKLVMMYAKCGNLLDARRLFDEMPKRNVVSWTAMIAAYARYGYNDAALRLYCQMRREGIQPNMFTFAGVLPACANLADLKHGREVHEDIIRTGFHSNVFVGSALVNMYAKCGEIEDARQVFDEMPERNVVSWTTMIAGYVQSENVDEALKLFREMPCRVYMPCIYVINKIDQITLEELEILDKLPHYCPVSAHLEWNLDGLLEKIWEYLDLTRIYTKPKGLNPDYEDPVILSSKKRTVEDFCLRIHKDMLKQFKYALVWGSSVKHKPQRVGRDHELEDEDVVQIIKKV